MVGNTVKEMTTNFGKLDKIEGHDYMRWPKEEHFCLHVEVVYVLTTPIRNCWKIQQWKLIRINFVRFNLNTKYMAEDSSSKKFLVSNFNNYKMVDSRPVMEQYNELLRILGQYTQHGLKMDESISVSSIIDKLPPSWKDFKHTLKHGKDDLSLVQLGSHLRIEESLRAQDSDKGKGKEVAGPSVNMTEEGKNKNNKQNKGKKRDFKEHGSGSGSNKKPKLECWKCGKTGHFKRDCRSGNKKNANAGGSGKGLMQLRGGLILVLQLMFVKIVGLKTIPKTKEKVSVIAEGDLGDSGTVSGLIPYRWKVELKQNDLDKTLRTNKGGEYYDPVFFQSVRIIHETTAPYKPQQNGVAERKIELLKKWLPKIKRSQYLDENRFLINPRPKEYIIQNSDNLQKMIILDDVPHIEIPEPLKGKPVDQARIFRAIDAWDVAMTKFHLLRVEWVFLLGGECHFLASKKQTCHHCSPMESSCSIGLLLVKKQEWLRNLIHEIPIWPKPIAPIFIRCDSAPTMAKAYSQIYNGKSRHLGVRHSMF
ncbi:zinc finger, CCHC-type containing protein [Tanacetum coccineum]